MSEQETTSVSTSFYPLAHGLAYDVVAASSDNVLFYLNTEVITAISRNAFRSILSQQVSTPTKGPAAQVNQVDIPEPATILDAMMHILYQLPFTNQIPQFKTLETSILALPKYDIDPAIHLVPQNPCYQALLSYISTNPLDLYALAAQFELEQLAAQASSHLLSYPISTLSDDIAQRIGAIHVKRLLSLHLDRLSSLRSILLGPPEEHDPNSECEGSRQKKLTSSWAMIAATNAWEARPDISTHLLQSSFEPLVKETSCELCRKSLQTRIAQVVSSWAKVPCTI